MNIRLALFSLIMILILNPPYLFSKDEPRVIVILPFINIGTSYKDLDETLFVSYFYLYFEQLRYFTAVYPHKILNYKAEKLYNTEDLYTLAVLGDIQKEFGSDFILGGEFKVVNQTLKVNIDIFGNDEKLVIQREYEAHIKTTIRDALLEIVLKAIRAVSQYNPETASFIATTDNPCTLYIDGIAFGRTPGKFILPVGDYDIEIVYEDRTFKKTIFKQQTALKKDNVVDPGKIQTLVTLSVKANVKSDVFIDGTKVGVTDLSIKIPVAHEYIIDVVYTDERKEQRYLKKTITTHNRQDICVEFHYPCRIKMVSGKLPLSGKVDDISGYKKLPYVFDNLAPGKYHVRVALEDNTWKRNWVVYNEKLLLYNTRTAVIDRSDFIYKNYWSLCFIPSAAQFYNFEPVKGTVILTISALSLAESITAYFLMKSNANNARIWNTYRIASWGGIAMLGSVYIYSCIDGMVTMWHLYKMLYP
ncbi:MAG: hypothetical protein JXB88_04620 [Spirochaetales bacterium]|nr:hypothetical protein [Spirochaetales bacterium]